MWNVWENMQQEQRKRGKQAMGRKYMKNVWKRAVVTVLALTITFLLAACGGDKGNGTSDNQAKQGVFRENDRTGQVSGIMTEGSNVAAMACYDNILYMLVNAYPEGGQTVTLHTWGKEGNKLSEAVVLTASSVTVNAGEFSITPQGNVLFTLDETGMDENGQIIEKTYLKSVDKKGTELFTLDIRSLAEGEEDLVVQSVVFSSEGTFYLLAWTKIFEVDAAGIL